MMVHGYHMRNANAPQSSRNLKSILYIRKNENYSLLGIFFVKGSLLAGYKTLLYAFKPVSPLVLLRFKGIINRRMFVTDRRILLLLDHCPIYIASLCENVYPLLPYLIRHRCSTGADLY